MSEIQDITWAIYYEALVSNFPIKEEHKKIKGKRKHSNGERETDFIQKEKTQLTND